MAKSEQIKPKASAVMLVLPLAWLVPGAGHLYLRRPVRAVVLFITVHVLFWSGVSVGGVFTVNPRDEIWWCRAQLCAGASGAISYWRQRAEYAKHERTAISAMGRAGGYATSEAHRREELAEEVNDILAGEGLALVPPASSLAYILSGVAGMLNLMCIFDALILSLMGRCGEPAPVGQRDQEQAA